MSHWREIVAAFLRLGATSYGGPAIMGVMQAELQERRQWLSKLDEVRRMIRRVVGTAAEAR